jgi:hypothetical protein
MRVHEDFEPPRNTAMPSAVVFKKASQRSGLTVHSLLAARTKDKPNQETNKRKQQDKHDPYYFAAYGCRALNDIHNCPNVGYQYQKTEYASDL